MSVNLTQFAQDEPTPKQQAEQHGFEFKTRLTSDGETLYYGQRGTFKTLGYLSLENAVKAAHKHIK